MISHEKEGLIDIKSRKTNCFGVRVRGRKNDHFSDHGVRTIVDGGHGDKQFSKEFDSGTSVGKKKEFALETKNPNILRGRLLGITYQRFC